MPVSRPLTHSDAQSAGQPISPLFHGEVCATAADKSCTIFPWHLGKNLLFSSLDPLISSCLSVLPPSFSTRKQVHAHQCYECGGCCESQRNCSSLDFKSAACVSTPCGVKITIMGHLIRSHFADLSNK